MLLGHFAQRHPRYADLRALAAGLAEVTGAALGYLSEGANGAGAALAGALPHRDVGGKSAAQAGADAQAMLAKARKAYVLFGIEPSHDLANGAAALEALRAAAVVCFTPYVTDELLDCADILVPMGTFAETAGTFVNVEGRWQSFDAAASSPATRGRAGACCGCSATSSSCRQCEYRTPSDVAAAIEQALGIARRPCRARRPIAALRADVRARAWAPRSSTCGIYAIDAVVRRSPALQQTVLARGAPEAAYESAVGASRRVLGAAAGELKS